MEDQKASRNSPASAETIVAAEPIISAAATAGTLTDLTLAERLIRERAAAASRIEELERAQTDLAADLERRAAVCGRMARAYTAENDHEGVSRNTGKEAAYRHAADPTHVKPLTDPIK
jgi:hypothetical protein